MIKPAAAAQLRIEGLVNIAISLICTDLIQILPEGPACRCDHDELIKSFLPGQ